MPPKDSDKLPASGEFFVHTEAVRALSEVLRDTGLTEIDYEQAGVRIRLSKAAPSVVYTENKLSPSFAAPTLTEEVALAPAIPSIKGQPVKSIRQTLPVQLNQSDSPSQSDS